MMIDYTKVEQHHGEWYATLMMWHDSENEYEAVPLNNWMTRDGAVKDAKDWAYNNDLEYRDE